MDRLILVKFDGAVQCFNLCTGAIEWQVQTSPEPLCCYTRLWSETSGASETNPQVGLPSQIPVMLGAFSSFDSAVHTYAVQGSDLFLVDDKPLLNRDLLVMSDAASLNSTDSTYTEVRLSDGKVLVSGVDDVRSPVAQGNSGDDSPVLAILRQNKRHSGRFRNAAHPIAWRFVTSLVSVMDLASPSLQSARFSAEPLAIEGSETHKIAAASYDKKMASKVLEVYVDGTFRERDASSGVVLWHDSVGGEVVRAFRYREDHASGEKLRELQLSVIRDEPLAPEESQIFAVSAKHFIFVAGELPQTYSVPKHALATHAAGCFRVKSVSWDKSAERANLRDALTARASNTAVTLSSSSNPSSATLTDQSNSEKHAAKRFFQVDEDSSSSSSSGEEEGSSHVVGADGEEADSTDGAMSSVKGSSFFDDGFDVVRVIGCGTSGIVLQCRQRVTGIDYAVKIVVSEDKLHELDVVREVRLHAPLQHDNVVRYHSCWSEVLSERRLAQLAQLRERHAQLQAAGGDLIGADDMSSCDDGRSATESTLTDSAAGGDARRNALFIQMEYCPETLAHYLSHRKSVDREETLAIASRILAGLQYLHSKCIVHRDVKPTNIFVDVDESDQPLVKLGDLGLAKPVGEQASGPVGYFVPSEEQTVGVGSPIYSSPEQLLGKKCSRADDVFSAGIVLVELCIQPKTVSERHSVLMKARRGEFDAPLRQAFPEIDVAAQMLHPVPEQRMPLKAAIAALRKLQRTYS